MQPSTWCTGAVSTSGKLVDHPEIMSQGETLEELEENLRDAWREMLLDDVPPDYQVRDIAL